MAMWQAGTRRRTAATVLLISALAVVPVAVVGPTAAATPVTAPAAVPVARPAALTPVRVSLTFEAARAKVGTRVDFTVRVRPYPSDVAYRSVKIQYRDGAGWRTLGSLKMRRDGTVSAWVSKETPAVRSYRAIFPATPETARGISPVRTITWYR
ncbi:MAG: hypothetical protein R2737_17965 [Candidatus Nanopelagicales bacterium]